MARGLASGRQGPVRLVPVAIAGYLSPQYKHLYFIAMRFKIVGAGTVTGVWASPSIHPGGGLVLAVDEFAQTFTVFPDADKTAAHISPVEAGVDKARSCLR
jgi:hypothetical protein